MVEKKGVKEAPRIGLPFERPIVELELKIGELKSLSEQTGMNLNGELRPLQEKLARMTREIYENLEPYDVVQIARHPLRPQTSDYISGMLDEYVELHGDRRYSDDRAITTGITMINTPGAYPGVGAEERGQAWAIAENIMVMSRLKTPIICAVIGEGGSGGALGIGVGDRVLMLQYAYYSVISPEGCAAILWKNGERAPDAATALRLTSADLLGFRVVDEIVPEPLGGAHRAPEEMIGTLKERLVAILEELGQVSPDELIEARYERLRALGQLESQ
jgi:acetyl-CoA carboxylase carboxyl transferase subunit alpha